MDFDRRQIRQIPRRQGGALRPPDRLSRQAQSAAAGPHAQSQHRRLYAGIARANRRLGHPDLTLDAVLEGTGVSAAAFGEYFDDTADCLISAQLDAFSRLRAAIGAATDTPAPWLEQLRAAVGAALEFAAAEPEAAWLLLIQDNANPAGEAFDTMKAYFVGLLRSGRRDLDPEPPQMSEPTYVGGVIMLVEGHLRAGTEAQLPAMADELTRMLALPYSEAARA